MSNSNSPTIDDDSGTGSLTVRNIGGIDHAELTLEPGVSVLTGRNATNRTSLLAALGSVLGGTTASLKSDAEEGFVSLSIDEETYTREYTRTATDVQTTGSAYTEQTTLVDLCVTLLEDNPARQAVERGDDLREVLMRPVDTEAIETRIAELRQEQQAVETELERVTERRLELSRLERTREQLVDDIDAVDHELAELRAVVAEFEADVEAADEASAVVETLNERRQELSAVSERIEVKQAEREALQNDIEELEAEREEFPEDLGDEVTTIEADLAAARSRKHELEDIIASLTTIVDFNDDMLGKDAPELGLEADTPDVTSELAPEAEQAVVCWTCGSHVQRGDISEQLDDLRDVIMEKRDTKQELDTRIDELQRRKQELEHLEDRQSTVRRRLDDMQEKVTACEETIAELTNERTQLREGIERLEQEVAETEELRESGLRETYERISDLQYERGQQQQQLADVTDTIDEIEALPTTETLEAQRDDLQDELERERGRVDELERQAVEVFNEHMDELLDILAYENIARVWIEKRTPEGTRGGIGTDTEFDVHIVREADEGTGYEDQIAHLSESEREVVGLVVALAGYLVHDGHDVVPFMLLDSLEAIDAQRIATLVDYLTTHVPYLIIALLPEDAAALSSNYEYITPDTLTV